MNQILSTNDEKSKSALGLKPIVRFFAIVLIILALIFGGQGISKLYESRKHNKEFPRASLTVQKVGSSVCLVLSDEIEISKIEYSWNNGSISEKKGIGKKNVTLDIEMPQGENILNVTAIDVNGNRTKFDSFKVEFSGDEDVTKPSISIEKGSVSGKLIITAKDDKELDYITYNWEGEEPITVKATGNNKKEIIQEISVEKGTKKIYVTAYDKAKNKAEKNLNVVGSTGPKITASVKDNSHFIVSVSSEVKISKITYTLNDVEHTVENIPKDAKEFKFEVKLQEGTNLLKINAYENDIMTEYKCKKTK